MVGTLHTATVTIVETATIGTIAVTTDTAMNATEIETDIATGTDARRINIAIAHILPITKLNLMVINPPTLQAAAHLLIVKPTMATSS